MKRMVGLDIVRAIAVMFVVAVHFLLNTKYYQMPLDGYGMIILTALRHLFLTCVPLFLLLTGYLNTNKELNKKYYKGIKKVLISFFFISIITIICRQYFLGEEKTLLRWIYELLTFTANPYSWYIELYIGLFLIIPFLNILYKSLETKNKKKLLIATLLILTTIPTIVNGIYLIKQTVWPIPDWWTNMWPITYYFIGSYIKEHQPKISFKKGLCYILLVLLIHTSVTWVLYGDKTFSRHYLGENWNILTLILSVLLFLTFYQKNIKSSNLKRIVSSISVVSLDIYLISYIIDLKIYKYVKPELLTPKDHVIAYIPTLIIVFTASYIFALIKKLIFDIIEKNKTKTTKMPNIS